MLKKLMYIFIIMLFSLNVYAETVIDDDYLKRFEYWSTGINEAIEKCEMEVVECNTFCTMADTPAKLKTECLKKCESDSVNRETTYTSCLLTYAKDANSYLTVKAKEYSDECTPYKYNDACYNSCKTSGECMDACALSEEKDEARWLFCKDQSYSKAENYFKEIVFVKFNEWKAKQNQIQSEQIITEENEVPETLKQNVFSVTSFKGSFVLVREGIEIPFVKGMDLKEGDKLYSGGNSEAILTYNNGNHKIIVGANSELSVDDPSKDGPQVMMGKIRALVNRLSGRQFNVRSTSGSYSVRGTDFIVYSQQDSTRSEVYVKDGSVELTSLTSGETKLIEAGQIGATDESGTIMTRTLSAEEWNDLSGTSQVSSNSMLITIFIILVVIVGGGIAYKQFFVKKKKR